MKRFSVLAWCLVVLASCAVEEPGDGSLASAEQALSAAAGSGAGEAPAAYSVTASATCYECTTRNFDTRLFSTLERAYASPEGVIRQSCHLIESQACEPFDPCASTTVCGEDPRSTYTGCVGDYCLSCHLYATCINSFGVRNCAQTVDCGSSFACDKVGKNSCE